MGLEWSPLYLTGMDAQDEQHKAFFREIGEFALSLLEGINAEALQAQFRDFAGRLREHMNEEEELMFQIGCLPEVMIEHAKDHQLFLHHLYEVNKMQMNLEELRVFLRYMSFWMRYHVLTIDRPVAHQLLAIQRGVSPRQAFLESAAVAHEAMPELFSDLHRTYAELYDSQLNVVRQNNRLRDARNELFTVNQALEDRVNERTGELVRANEQLHEEYTALERVTKELEMTHRQLIQSDKMAAIGQLAAGVAHEINNPIGFVNANLGTLKNYVATFVELINFYEQIADELPKAVQDKLVAYRQQIEIDYVKNDIVDLLAESAEGLDRVKQIIQDLKTFARADDAVFVEADLVRGIESTLNVVWNELKYKTQVHRDFSETLPRVSCVPAQINQVLMNILVNAAHAIEKQGDIWIRTGYDPQQVWIEIEDNGCGMSEEVRSKIFEPFFTTKSVGEGTGLGLSLAYNIMQKHKGRIEVTSTLGQGSCFRIILPRTAEQG